MGKRFVAVRVIADRYQLSQLKIWSLARVGWIGKRGKPRAVEYKWDKMFGSCFAEEDVVEWIQSHPIEYRELQLRHLQSEMV